MFTNVSHMRASDARDNHHSAWILGCSGSGEHRCEQANGVEDTSNIQIQYLLTAGVRRWFEGPSPGCTGICNQDVEFGFVLLDFGDQTLYIANLSHIGWDADRSTFDSWESVQFLNGLVNALRTACFPRRDEDGTSSVVKECRCCMET